MSEPLRDTVVLYHGDCKDGFGAAYAAWKKFGDSASYLPVRDHHRLPAALTDKILYVVDFSYPRTILEQLRAANRSVVVIDHHQSAREDVEAFAENVFDNDHSGAVLAWRYFHPEVETPELLTYVEDHDLWRFALPEHREYNAALAEVPMTFADWDTLVARLEDSNERIRFVATGALLARFEDKLVAKLLTYKERVSFAGHEVWALNVSRVYRSILGNHLAEQNEADGGTPLGIVYYRAKGEVNVSLRSRGDVDVATLAEAHGGGGHKHAASFSVPHFKDLPFTFLENPLE